MTGPARESGYGSLRRRGPVCMVILASRAPRCPGGTSRGVAASMTKISEDTSGLVSIGQLARDAGVSSRTVRYYEELGILPEPRRSAGGTRMYPQEYRGYLAAALALKDLGFRLDEMRALARLAAGRQVSPNQRDAAAALVQDRIEALAMQVIMLDRKST